MESNTGVRHMLPGETLSRGKTPRGDGIPAAPCLIHWAIGRLVGRPSFMGSAAGGLHRTSGRVIVGAPKNESTVPCHWALVKSGKLFGSIVGEFFRSSDVLASVR